MKRPEKLNTDHFYNPSMVYECTDIDPTLDRLERLREVAQIGINATNYALKQHENMNTLPDEYKKPFPTMEEFTSDNVVFGDMPTFQQKLIYDYFAKFQYETKVFPKVGDMVEGEMANGDIIIGKLHSYVIKSGGHSPFTHLTHLPSIRPISTPTRSEVLEKARRLGLSEEEIQILEE